ncbi:MAG: cytochrome c oxidase caa3 assembly factor family protein [Glaciihabitans sp.]|nr:cytochrome c oxidase caa3 assembly factor family protein [Glaciihabitans sp.]
MHHLGGAPVAGFGATIASILVFVAALYVWPAITRRMGRRWPVHRSLCWVAGLGCVFVGWMVSAGSGAAPDFVAHTLGHILTGMLAPLLLVLAAPVTLALRSMDVVPARRLSRMMKWRWVRVITHPVPALILNAGGLWLLYGTELYGWMHGNVLLALGLQIHFLLAGYLFTASLIAIDPIAHRPGYLFRSVVLLIGLATHNVLSKFIYAHPPVGVSPTDAAAGSMWMYYGGGVVEASVIVLLCARWFRATRPRQSMAALSRS